MAHESPQFVQFLRKILRWGPSEGVAGNAPTSPQSAASQAKSTTNSLVSNNSSELSSPAVAFNVDSPPGPRTGKSTPGADAASVLTIASSSKRHRRRSIDTNASTRALVAESIFSRTESVETEG